MNYPDFVREHDLVKSRYHCSLFELTKRASVLRRGAFGMSESLGSELFLHIRARLDSLLDGHHLGLILLVHKDVAGRGTTFWPEQVLEEVHLQS